MDPTLQHDADGVNNLIESIKADLRNVQGKILELHEDFVTMGRKLIKLKELTPHGEWGERVKALGLTEHLDQRVRRAAKAVDEGRVPPGLKLSRVLKLIAATKVKPDNSSGLTANPPAVDRQVVPLDEIDPGPEDPTAVSWLDETPAEQAAREDPEERVMIALWQLRELEGHAQRSRSLTDENTALKRKVRLLEATVSGEAAEEVEKVALEMQVQQSRIDELTTDLGRANARIKHLLRERGQR